MYIVLKLHTFDPEREAHVFEDYADARDYLQEAWEDYFNTEIAENEAGLDFDQCYHEDDYAVVTFKDREMTEWFLDEAIEGRGK